MHENSDDKNGVGQKDELIIWSDVFNCPLRSVKKIIWKYLILTAILIVNKKESLDNKRK